MQELTSIIRGATKSISKEYFQLPVAGQEDPIYRERVYCYELYHRIRSLWPENTQYSLSGEVDKLGHRLVRGSNLDRTKPDFLVHVPGKMDHNELVMEVKPINSQKEGLKKDLQTLTAYRRHANYQRAILLVYGGSGLEFNQCRDNLKYFAERSRNVSISLQLIELWHHRLGEPAVSSGW